MAKPFSLPEAPHNLHRHDADQLHLTPVSSLDPFCWWVETRLLLSKAFDRRYHPCDRLRSQLQHRWESYPRIPELPEPIEQPGRTCQRGFGDYLRPAASMHLQLTSQGDQILVMSSSASSAPEGNRCPLTPPLDSQNFDLSFVASLWVWIPRWHLCRSANSRSFCRRH